MVFPWFARGFPILPLVGSSCARSFPRLARPLDPEIVVALRSEGRGPTLNVVGNHDGTCGFNDGLMRF